MKQYRDEEWEEDSSKMYQAKSAENQVCVCMWGLGVFEVAQNGRKHILVLKSTEIFKSEKFVSGATSKL